MVILGNPTLAAPGINEYDSLGECARKRNLSVQGAESMNFRECRRVSIAVEPLLQRGSGAPEPPNEAVEQFVSHVPDMGMAPEQEERDRSVALARAVNTVVANGLSVGSGARLREISECYWNAFRRGLRGDPPAHVEPFTVTPDAKVIRVRGHVYSLNKTAWLSLYIEILIALGLVFGNLQVVWASAVMAVPKVSDYHAVSK